MLNRSSLDDAKLLKQELSSVQRLMDEMTQAKEKEKRELQKKFDELQLEHETLKNVSTVIICLFFLSKVIYFD